MASNPFDAFDAPAPKKQENPFDAFDAPVQPAQAAQQPVVQVEKPTAPAPTAPSVADAIVAATPNEPVVAPVTDPKKVAIIKELVGDGRQLGQDIEAPGFQNLQSGGIRMGNTTMGATRPKQPVIKPFFDAVGDSFARSWLGSTQSDLYKGLARRLNAKNLLAKSGVPAVEARRNELQSRFNTRTAFSGLSNEEYEELKDLNNLFNTQGDIGANLESEIGKMKILIKDTNEQLKTVPGTTQGMANLEKAKGAWESTKAIAANPLDIFMEGLAGSLTGTVKGAVAAAATAAAARRGGAGPSAVKWGGLVGAGMSTAGDSYDGNLLEKLVKWGEANGVDVLSDVDGWVNAAMKDPENFDKEYAKARQEAQFEANVEGGAVTALGGLMNALPGGKKWLARALIGRGKEAFEEVGTTLAANIAKGDLGTSQDYLLSALLGFGMGGTEDIGGNALAGTVSPQLTAQQNADRLNTIGLGTVLSTAPVAPTSGAAQPPPAAPTPAAAAPVAPVAPTPVAPTPTPAGPIAGEVPPAPAATPAPAAAAPAPAPAATPAAPSVTDEDPTIFLQQQLASAQAVQSEFDAAKANAEFEVEAAEAALKDDPENEQKIEAVRKAKAVLAGKEAGLDAANKQIADITSQLEKASAEYAQRQGNTPAAPATPAPAPTPAPAAQATPAPAPAPTATPAPTPAPAPAYNGGDPRDDPRFDDLDRETKSKLRRDYQRLLEQQQKLAEMKAKNYKTERKEAQIANIKNTIARTLGDYNAAPAPTAQAAPAAAPAPTPAPQAAPAPTPAPAAQSDTKNSKIADLAPNGVLYRSEGKTVSNPGEGAVFFTGDKSYAELYQNEDRVMRTAELPSNVADIRDKSDRDSIRAWIVSKISSLEQSENLTANARSFIRDAKKALAETDTPQSVARAMANVGFAMSDSEGKGFGVPGNAEKAFMTDYGFEAMTVPENGRNNGQEFSVAFRENPKESTPAAQSTPAPTAQADAQAAPDTQTQPTPAPQATPAPAPTPAPQATQPAPAPAPQAAPAPKPRSSLVEGLRGGLDAIRGRERSNAPAPQVQPSGTPASSDPRNDRRFEALNRNLKQDIRVLHNKVINDEKAREKLIKEGRKTKNLDDRIAQNKEKIERILSGQPAAKPNTPVDPNIAPIDPMAADQTYEYDETPAAPSNESSQAREDSSPRSKDTPLDQLLEKDVMRGNRPAYADAQGPNVKPEGVFKLLQSGLAPQEPINPDLAYNVGRTTEERKQGKYAPMKVTVVGDRLTLKIGNMTENYSVPNRSRDGWRGIIEEIRRRHSGKYDNVIVESVTNSAPIEAKNQTAVQPEKNEQPAKRKPFSYDETTGQKRGAIDEALGDFMLEGKYVGDFEPNKTAREVLEKIIQLKGSMSKVAQAILDLADPVSLSRRVTSGDVEGGHWSPLRKKTDWSLDKQLPNGESPFTYDEEIYVGAVGYGVFGEDKNTIEEIAIEEILHAATASKYPPDLRAALGKAIKLPERGPIDINKSRTEKEIEVAREYAKNGKNKEWRDLCRAYIAFVEEMQKRTFRPSGIIQSGINYRASNLAEFIIGAVSEPEVQRILAGIKDPEYKQSLFRTLIDAVMKAFNISQEKMESMLGTALSSIDKITSGERTLKPGEGYYGPLTKKEIEQVNRGDYSPRSQDHNSDPFAESAAEMIRQDAEDQSKNVTTPVRRNRGGLFDPDKPAPNSELAQFYEDQIRALDRRINQFKGNEQLRDEVTGEPISEEDMPPPDLMEYLVKKYTREREALAERLDAVRMGDAEEGNRLASKTGLAFREEAKYARDKAKQLAKSAVTEKQKKLAADLKEAAKGDPVTLMERITKILDAWELDTLGPDDKPSNRALSINPQALSAWAYRISKLIAKTGIKFGAWAKTMAGKMSKQNMKEVWSRAVAIARSPISLVKHFLDSRADKLWEYADRYENSATMRELANLIFTRSGPDADAVRNSIPQRIKQIRTQFANKYSNILNRFATEFSKMDEAKRKAWDRQFRRYVIGLDPLPAGDLGQAVIEFRQLMQEMLNYQKKAGIDMGDAGEGYFPRIWSSKKIQENIQKFYDAAKEMYRRRDQRLLNKAIDEINQGVDAEAARKKDLDQKAGRRVKPDAEYQQDARNRADERIAELQAEHDAKDDAHYQQMAEDWAWRAQNGRLDEVSITDTNTKSANAPDHTDPRTFTAEEAAIADDFLDDDIDKTVMRYVSAAVKKSELARVFGKDGKVLAKMMIELGKDGVTEKERNHIKKLLQQSLDVSNNRLEGFDAEFFDWANFVVVSGYLGLSYINNLFLEPVSYGIRTGSPYLALKAVALTWQNFASELVRSVNDSNAVRKHYKNRKEFSKAMDMALAETLGLTHVELDRIAQDSHWDFNADAEESGSPTARWLTQRVLKANLMEQSERAKVATSMAIARNHILNVAKTFRGKSALQNVFSVVPKLDVNAESAARSMLREMGVDDSFHDSFCTFVESLKGMNDADYMAAVTGGSQEAILYRQALQRTSTGMAISSDPSMKTEGSDSIFGKMLMQLMNYSYAYSQLVKDHMYDSALGVFKKSTPQEQIKAMDRLKYAMPLLAGGAMTTVASLATKLLVTSMFPSDAGDEWLENEEEVMVLDAASYAGMFGKKFEYLSRMVVRKQVPMGPIPEAGGKGVIALATAIQKQGDSDRANYNALKSVQRTGITPLVVGAASAANPALGTYANYKMRDREFADAILEGLTGVEKPKK